MAFADELQGLRTSLDARAARNAAQIRSAGDAAGSTGNLFQDAAKVSGGLFAADPGSRRAQVQGDLGRLTSKGDYLGAAKKVGASLMDGLIGTNTATTPTSKFMDPGSVQEVTYGKIPGLTPIDKVKADAATQAAETAAQTKNPQGLRVQGTSVPGVTRVNGGSSPLFTNIDPVTAVSEMNGMKSGVGTVNTIPSAGLRTLDPSMSAALADARAAAADRGDFDSLRKSYQQGGGTWLGETADQSAQKEYRSSLMDAMQSRNPATRAAAMQALTWMDKNNQDALLRKDELGLKREQFDAEANLRDAQANYYNAGAKGLRSGNGQKPSYDGSKFLDSAIEGYFTNEKGALDKGAMTNFRQYLASQPVDVPGVGKVSLATLSTLDPEAVHRLLPSVLANYAGQQGLQEREGGQLPPAAARGLRAMQTGDRVGTIEGLIGGLTGRQVIDYGDGRVVPLDAVDPKLRNLVKANFSQKN